MVAKLHVQNGMHVQYGAIEKDEAMSEKPTEGEKLDRVAEDHADRDGSCPFLTEQRENFYFRVMGDYVHRERNALVNLLLMRVHQQIVGGEKCITNEEKCFINYVK